MSARTRRRKGLTKVTVALFVCLLGIFAAPVVQAEHVPDPDLNNDGVVDQADLDIIKGSIGKRCGDPGFNELADTNDDCLVNGFDLFFVARAFGQTGFPTENGDAIPPVVTITGPADGATVPEGALLVRGTVEASGEEVGVTVNDLPAAVEGNTFAVPVPVIPDTTTLTAVATTASGGTVSDTIGLTVTPTDPNLILRLRANPPSGVSSLAVAFSLVGGPVPTAIDLDLEGDGGVEFSGPSLDGQTFTYLDPGLFFPTVTLTDANGNQFTARAVLQVLDQAALDALLQTKWTGMKAALQQSNIPAALQFIVSETRDNYQALFSELTPLLPTVGADLGDIRFVELRADVAEYELLVVEDSQTISYYVEFIRDSDGLWRVSFF